MYKMKSFSATKKEKKILPLEIIWMNPEDSIFIEISQMQKKKYCMISLYVESKKVKLREAESRTAVARGWGVREMGEGYWSKR